MHLLLVSWYTVFSVNWSVLQFMFIDMLKQIFLMHITESLLWNIHEQHANKQHSGNPHNPRNLICAFI